MSCLLVTGGAGYIGAHLVQALGDAGRRVVILDDLSAGRREAVDPRAECVIGDCGDADLVRKLIADRGIDAIFHLAASIVVADSIADPLSYYRNNVVNSHHLLAAAQAAGVKRIVFSSSAAVYGEASGSAPIDENAPCRPLSPYGFTKLAVEIMLADMRRAYGLDFAALRYFNVCGADDRGRMPPPPPQATHLIRLACRTALGLQDALSIFGDDYPTPDGSCIRDYVDVVDLAQAHLAALAAMEEGRHVGVLNCGYGRGSSVFDVVAAVERATQRPLPRRVVARRPGDPTRLVADVGRLRRELDWRPQFDNLDFMIARALRWEAGDWDAPLTALRRCA